MTDEAPKTWKGEVRIRCPFCGGVAEVGYDGAVHMEPACQVFLDLEVHDYVHEVHEFLMKTKDPGRQPS